MPLANEVLVIFGSGPGIGVSVANVFASKGPFSHVALVARREEQLQKDAEAVRKSAAQVQVSTHVGDLADLDSLAALFGRLEQLGSLSCVLFNGARVAPSTVLQTPSSEILLDFQICTLALYEVAKWSIPLLKNSKSAAPSLLTTNSRLYVEPIPWIFSLSLNKAAQRNLVQSLEAVHGKDVHIGLLSVEGFVSRDAGREHMSPEFIAERAWEWYSQPRSSWNREVEILEKDPEVYKAAFKGPPGA